MAHGLCAAHLCCIVGHRDRYRRRSPSPRGYRGRDSHRDSYRRRSPPAPYYNRPRRTPPRSGTTLFVAGLNFVTTERVGPHLCTFLTLWQLDYLDVRDQRNDGPGACLCRVPEDGEV